MKILDVLTEPWAIIPQKKAEIDEIYATHLRGEKIDLSVIEAATGKSMKNEPIGYDVVDGVAIIEMSGVMAKKMNLFAQISGGVSTQMMTQAVRAAVADPMVRAIALVIDSPGGAVDGTQELAAAIADAAAQKPTAAIADGIMASAAYWAGSAAGAVFATSDLTQLGSIGVVATHVDVSGAQAQRGVKTTEIAAGKFKRIVSQYAPLSPEGRDTMQAQVDYIYNVFLDGVATNRGLESRDVAHTQMGDGRIFFGQQAVDAGLADGIASVDQVVAQLRAGTIPLKPMMSSSRSAAAVSAGAAPVAGPAVPARPVRPALPAAGAAAPSHLTQENSMSDNDVQAKIDAAVAAAVQTERAAAEAKVTAAVATAKADGATAERTRIQSVMAQAMPGHDALIQTLAFDGTTTGPEAAVQVLAAEKAKLGKTKADLKADAPTAVPFAAAPDPAKETPAATVKTEAQQMAEAGNVAAKAARYIDDEAKAGRRVSAAEAVAHITAEEAK